MLDVHPPHHAANSWRDFFIHIATIVVGLLIAVGLEQTVEYLHHRHQVAEAHEALRKEYELNVKLYAVKVEEFSRMTPILETDLANFEYLKKHPGASAQELPGRFSWFNYTVVHLDSAWRNAKQAGVVEFMPEGEVRRNDELYKHLDLTTDATVAFRNALYEARSYTLNDPDPSHLSPAAVDRQLELMNKLLLAHAVEGGLQRNVSARFKEFPSPSPAELDAIFRLPIDPRDLAAVRAISVKVRAVTAEAEAEEK